MILHVPHASKLIPDKAEYLNSASLKTSIDLLTDHFTDELFFHPNSDAVLFKYSRLWCDVERYVDDDEEPMSKMGMGMFYNKDVFGDELRDQSDYLAAYDSYTNHHLRLGHAVSDQLNWFPFVVVVDCHSFYPFRMGHEPEGLRPDICIGTNPDTPKSLVQDLVNYTKSCGLSVAINSPFSGSMMPAKFYEDERVTSVMIEVNRKLYLEVPYIGKKSKNFKATQDFINNLLDIVNQYETRLDK